MFRCTAQANNRLVSRVDHADLQYPFEAYRAGLLVPFIHISLFSHEEEGERFSGREEMHYKENSLIQFLVSLVISGSRSWKDLNLTPWKAVEIRLDQ